MTDKSQLSRCISFFWMLAWAAATVFIFFDSAAAHGSRIGTGFIGAILLPGINLPLVGFIAHKRGPANCKVIIGLLFVINIGSAFLLTIISQYVHLLPMSLHLSIWVGIEIVAAYVLVRFNLQGGTLGSVRWT